ncbi:MAG: ATP-dependent RNA helicase DbpA [Methylococcales bacterium]|nr:ATP-dependent RNA helicase DbpA [Methylococcales bacterium]MDD5753317.1 ATP-dependent RNA helicase DbpA [Methylococcales bacterium]
MQQPVKFSSADISAPLLQSIEALGYTEMTPIQAQSIPFILAGDDIIAKAKTGSGKTVAFGIGLLSKLDVNLYETQALVLCPTRELADQVSKAIRSLAIFIPNIKLLTLCGGVPQGHQIASLNQHAPHIVVGTPGRIQDHLKRQSLSLKKLRVLVLDEADRMLDMGFEDQISFVVKQTSKTKQTLLFSATYPDSILEMSAHIQQSPVEITVDETHHEGQIEQFFYKAEELQKPLAVVALLAKHQPESTVIFCNTKYNCQVIEDWLGQQGYSALSLTGDLDQRERDQTLLRFANKSCSVLVATDVAARGLDIKDLSTVIIYDLSPDPEVHVHRVGRTGRAGQKGFAFSLCAESELERAKAIETYQNTSIKWDKFNPAKLPKNTTLRPAMVTLVIDGGRKSKIRAADILGALTGEAGLAGSEVGKIDIFDVRTYVAIKRTSANIALSRLQEGKIKGRKLRVRALG